MRFIGSITWDLNEEDDNCEVISLDENSYYKPIYDSLHLVKEDVKHLLRQSCEQKQKIEKQNQLLKDEIEKRKLYERQLFASKINAEHASDAKSEFLARMSHEIRTPLNAIIGMTDLTLMTDKDPEAFDYLITIKESADHLLTVLNDVLDFSKIESGKFELENIAFDLRSLLEGTAKAFLLQATKQRIPLKLEIDEKSPRFFKGDPARFRQIFYNLTSNALKFTEKGEILLKTRTYASHESEIVEKKGLHYMHFSIRDSGIGITEEKLNLIFEEFAQAESSTSRKYGGSGLGLTICRELIKLMGGRIWVSSKVGEGSEFSFVIPLLEVTEKEYQSSLLKKQTIHEDKNENFNILIAEDNAVNAKLETIVLKKLGHSVSIANNGRDTINILSKGNFDIVIMDIEMPVMDGFEATRRIRNGEAGDRYCNIPIIALTAHAINEIHEKCLRIGMNDYISKPIRIDQLQSILLKNSY